MSQRNRLSHWLLAAGVLGVALLTASIESSSARLANAPAAQAAVAQRLAQRPAVASITRALPAHLGVAANFPRQRYIVQAESADAARDAVAHAGGVVTGDLSVIRAVAASLDEH